MKNAINWFEIPVSNYERAKKFYSEILGVTITDFHMPEKNMKYFIFCMKYFMSHVLYLI